MVKNGKIILIFSAIIFIASACKQVRKQPDTSSQSEVLLEEQKEILIPKTPYEFVPEGYKFYSEAWGDLDKDGIDDCVLIIEATEPSYSEFDEYRDTTIYHYRRGVVVAFKKGENYELILQNADFFESDNEDGGVYYAPILSWAIHRGNLIFSYEAGRYGSTTYTFRYQNNDFELIGFDEGIGSVQYTKTAYSINFLTKKMKTTIYDDREEEAEPQYEPIIQWKNIKVNKLYKLSKGTIADVSDYVFHNFIYVED